jgi:hypothetical protein
MPPVNGFASEAGRRNRHLHDSLAPDELRAALDRAEYKRRELAEPGPLTLGMPTLILLGLHKYESASTPKKSNAP